MELVMESRWLSFAVRIGDRNKRPSIQDQPGEVLVSSGSHEVAPQQFGFQHRGGPL